MKRIVFADIDGCMGNFVKPEFPLKQDLTGNLEGLARIKEKTEEFKNTIFGVCTGRAHHTADNIMEHSNHKGISIFEMGNVVHDPEIGTYNLCEKHPNLKEHVDSIKAFIEWKNQMIDFESEIKTKFNGSGVRQMKDRTVMLTYEFDKDIGKELYSYIFNKNMPGEVKSAITNGALKVLFCDMAIDILPNLNKGNAASFLMEKMNITKNNSLSIGDSSHSDLDLLHTTGLVGCPHNADNTLKEFVRLRNGFLSEKTYADGFLDILDMVKKRWANEK